MLESERTSFNSFNDQVVGITCAVEVSKARFSSRLPPSSVSTESMYLTRRYLFCSGFDQAVWDLASAEKECTDPVIGKTDGHCTWKIGDEGVIISSA